MQLAPSAPRSGSRTGAAATAAPTYQPTPDATDPRCRSSTPGTLAHARTARPELDRHDASARRADTNGGVRLHADGDDGTSLTLALRTITSTHRALGP